ncbi:uncharacterized protein CIMG_00439 [Coccidioides immitis RS]|uniref:Uncharacterized protein n=7 Tax=Coccidioides TaxID=5500 RepID=A0A0E1S4F8_COCIM|nr:uncharacterized protein CIMG_00439 [Coccidioides immitis RS]XP_003066549.1 hypothetical protein CPC735_057740 [Coccidioides posadasii C735 delta SOWgp]EFW18508.1 conserved hypothetical protein [Coccidioides posadasii str. Silveira]KMM66114.1 hypothetical protein CPAG_02454 [Coccidioides posadasii RMSCC 3488]KMP00301.1 hypothetical protein CIRG_00443 [Coccidioides immitis RMSCC 2394]KMU84489.1 hypothetical protein CIHG_02273 [Coccidioides immitis H538.4]TPX26629.1 hypothetical protein DIZ76|eukprot:XP_003066549.1 hypothetical protein CPC735_057740 [Coccidioides posadasii C735 delta SOWgp]
MSSIAANVARRAILRQPLRTVRAQPVRRYASRVEEAGLDKGPKRDPELYLLLGVMAGAFGLAGWYFGRSPTTVTSESNIRIGESAMPWEVDEKDVEAQGNFKYQYHPHGDKNKPLKSAPSALNEVVIPNVTLPKDLHDRFNKYGKDY